MAIDHRDGLRILIIEDQHDIAANIWDFLERRGYVMDHCADGISGLTRAIGGGFDVIVLDLGLPRLDGLDLCRQLRAAGHGVPVLMLTARDTLEDKLRGFGEGADDYMIKPFAMHELEARLRALHRRVQPTPTTLECGGLSYNSATMLATRDGRKVPLTRLQGSILATLLGDAPKVTSHQRLLQAAWGEDDGDIAALHTQIYELRAVIDRPFAHAMIQSVRGVGYRLVAVPS